MEKSERTNRLLPLVSNEAPGALPIVSDARVLSSFLQGDQTVCYRIESGRGAYLYLLEGGPILVNEHRLPELGAAKAAAESDLAITAERDSELLPVDVQLIGEVCGAG